MTSYEDLVVRIAELQLEIDSTKVLAEEARKSEYAGSVAQINMMIQKLGLTSAHLTFPTKPTRAAAIAKYRDPVSGKTWTGRGKKPTWISGRDKSQFIIQP